MFKDCLLVIPTYNNANTLFTLLDEIGKELLPILVVNDGSTDATKEKLKKIKNIHQIHFTKNKGKGVAIKAGIRWGIQQGYMNVLTMDSDGQHFPHDLSKFLDTHARYPERMLIGCRELKKLPVPKKNRIAQRLSDLFFIIQTGKKLKDTQSGFRLYPLSPLNNLRLFGSRYELEMEIMVRMIWKNVAIQPILIASAYDKKKIVSHFRPFTDFMRITMVQLLLSLGALLYIWPKKLISHFVPIPFAQAQTN